MFGRRCECQSELQTLKDRLGKVEARVSSVESEPRKLRLEWEEVLDKVYRWMQRTSRREKVDAGDAGGAEKAAEVNGALHPAVARIWARRAGRGLHQGVPGEG